LIKDNLISSAEWFAWVVPGYSCSLDPTINPNFRNNVGHSSKAGWMGLQIDSNCQKYSHFTAYKNNEEGFVNRFMIHKLLIENMIFADNANALAINGGAKT